MTIFITKGTLQLIKEYADDYHCLELLQFFGKYSCARFNRLAIIHALNNNGNSHRVEEALKRLVDNKLVNTCSVQGTTLYSLTGDKTLHDIVSNIATFDLLQRHVVLKNKNSCLPEQPGFDLRESNASLTFAGTICCQPERSLISVAAK